MGREPLPYGRPAGPEAEEYCLEEDGEPGLLAAVLDPFDAYPVLFDPTEDDAGRADEELLFSVPLWALLAFFALFL